MDDVAGLAREGAPEGLVVVADAQAAGRGRHSREWQSKPGDDLLISILFRPRPAIAVEISPVISLCLAQLVDERCGVSSSIKWPNDLRVDDRKIAGILLESVQSADGLAVVAGIGLNVNSKMRQANPDGLAAVSMSEVADRRFDTQELFDDLLVKIDAMYSEINSGSTVLPEWRDRLETLGQEVQVTFVEGSGTKRTLAGIAEDTDSQGRLMVRDEAGRVWPVSAGEVTLRRQSTES